MFAANSDVLAKLRGFQQGKQQLQILNVTVKHFLAPLKSKTGLDTLGKQTVALSFTVHVKLQHPAFPTRCIFKMPDSVKAATDDGPGSPASSYVTAATFMRRRLIKPPPKIRASLQTCCWGSLKSSRRFWKVARAISQVAKLAALENVGSEGTSAICGLSVSVQFSQIEFYIQHR